MIQKINLGEILDISSIQSTILVPTFIFFGFNQIYNSFIKWKRIAKEKITKRRNTTTKRIKLSGTKTSKPAANSKKGLISTALMSWQTSWRKNMIKWWVNFQIVPIVLTKISWSTFSDSEITWFRIKNRSFWLFSRKITLRVARSYIESWFRKGNMFT